MNITLNLSNKNYRFRKGQKVFFTTHRCNFSKTFVLVFYFHSQSFDGYQKEEAVETFLLFFLYLKRVCRLFN